MVTLQAARGAWPECPGGYMEPGPNKPFGVGARAARVLAAFRFSRAAVRRGPPPTRRASSRRRRGGARSARHTSSRGRGAVAGGGRTGADGPAKLRATPFPPE